jgi:hypothetical protein
VEKLHHYVKFNSACKEDLRMWLFFLKRWNGVSVFYESTLTSNADMELYTYASSTIGYGRCFQGRWFAEPWPENLFPQENPHPWLSWNYIP